MEGTSEEKPPDKGVANGGKENTNKRGEIWANFSQQVNSLRNSNVRPLPAHIRPRECRCKKGECPIYTSRQEHSKGRRFYCCPFNRTPQDCRFFEWIDDTDDPIVELKFQLENHEETMKKVFPILVTRLPHALMCTSSNIKETPLEEKAYTTFSQTITV
ncbi:hypothetical protein QJS04_geneDACA021566 [Acorus gramineus]|uniref:GRF-type domain-containing protein n=1 Tax=Acorus gramineus TaxID=55184 RepID=A0AAV9B2Q4_ACOGR|nr:hypothetical protein QJS04_geneDACA021566 [Acorus gramineus]